MQPWRGTRYCEGQMNNLQKSSCLTSFTDKGILCCLKHFFGLAALFQTCVGDTRLAMEKQRKLCVNSFVCQMLKVIKNVMEETFTRNYYALAHATMSTL